jgi:hypothetical protein
MVNNNRNALPESGTKFIKNCRILKNHRLINYGLTLVNREGFPDDTRGLFQDFYPHHFNTGITDSKYLKLIITDYYIFF